MSHKVKKHYLPVHCGDGIRREFFRRVEPNEFNRLYIIMEWLQEEHYAEWCQGYGEPGYSDPNTGVLLANWNNIPKRFQDFLEEKGFDLVWGDEWMIDYDNSMAYRTKPDSHWWEPSWVNVGDTFYFRDEDHAAIIEGLSVTNSKWPPEVLPSWVTEDDLLGEEYEFFKFGDDKPHGRRKLIEEAFRLGSPVERAVFKLSKDGHSVECWVLNQEED